MPKKIDIKEIKANTNINLYLSFLIKFIKNKKLTDKKIKNITK
tara:strand:- start:1721 stop:1849 length:129 start_codon:yes stop_codon:yes gene_type:complete